MESALFDNGHSISLVKTPFLPEVLYYPESLNLKAGDLFIWPPGEQGYIMLALEVRGNEAKVRYATVEEYQRQLREQRNGR